MNLGIEKAQQMQYTKWLLEFQASVIKISDDVFRWKCEGKKETWNLVT